MTVNGVPPGPPIPEPTRHTCDLCGGDVLWDVQRRFGTPKGTIFHTDSSISYETCRGSWSYGEDQVPVWGAVEPTVIEEDELVLEEAS